MGHEFNIDDDTDILWGKIIYIKIDLDALSYMHMYVHKNSRSCTLKTCTLDCMQIIPKKMKSKSKNIQQQQKVPMMLPGQL